MIRDAEISECRRYRYTLERGEIMDKGTTLVIMVNPSTADAQKDDATIRKLLGFRARHNWGWLTVCNLFAFRATDVRELAGQEDPVGPDNDKALLATLQKRFRPVERVIYAWGPLAKQPRGLRDRWMRVHEIVLGHNHKPLCIGLPAKDGHPKHPLMLPYDSPLINWGLPF